MAKSNKMAKATDLQERVLTTQPRALVPLTAGDEEETFRSPVHLELYKLGRSPTRMGRARQLLLGEFVEEDTERILTQLQRDLEFTLPELRCLHAIQVLLHQTGYQGNALPEVGSWTMGTAAQGRHPAIRIKPVEFARAVLGREDDERVTGKAWEIVREGLERLAEPRWIVYGRTYFKKGKKMVEPIRTKEPLVRIFEAHSSREATQENMEELLRQGSQVGQAKELVLLLGPLLVEKLSTFYTRKPVDLHARIQEIMGRRRVSTAILLFVDLLYTKDQEEFKISEDYLAETLGLDGYIRQRKRHMVRKRINECLEVATELGLLRAHSRNGMGVLRIELNAERFSRITAGDTQGDEDEE